MNRNNVSIHHHESGELLGFVTQTFDDIWEAKTIFGYVIERCRSSSGAEKIVREKSGEFVKGIWQYLDKDDQSWHPCVIKNFSQAGVEIVRTNPMGYQDRENYKIVMIESPNESSLAKSS